MTAVTVVVGLFFFQPAGDIRSADEPTTGGTALPDPDRFSAVEIPTEFVEAYGSLDADRAAS